jgi:hypothetical protein
MTFLPRQARDKHRENSKEDRFVAANSYYLPLYGNIPTHYLPNATGPPAWVNSSSLTNVVNYRNSTGGRNQLWWDDPATYATKVSHRVVSFPTHCSYGNRWFAKTGSGQSQ